MKWFILIFVFILGQGLSPGSEYTPTTSPTTKENKARVWTAKSEESIVAKFVTLDDNTVIFEKMDGTLIKTSLKELIPSDIDLIKKHYAIKEQVSPKPISSIEVEKQDITEGEKPEKINLPNDSASLPPQAPIGFIPQQRIFDEILSVKALNNVDERKALEAYKKTLQNFLRYVPTFNIPKNILGQDSVFNKSYLQTINKKDVPIEKRTNMLTGEFLVTHNLPWEKEKWEKVDQTLTYTKTSFTSSWYIMQIDTLKSKTKTKVCILAFDVRTVPNFENFTQSRYIEVNDDAVWLIGLKNQNPTDPKYLTMFSNKAIRYDFQIGINYKLNTHFVHITANQHGELMTNPWEQMAIGFNINKGTTGIKDALKFNDSVSLNRPFEFSQDRYDMQGKPLPVIPIWEKYKQKKQNEEPPLNMRENIFNLFPEKSPKK